MITSQEELQSILNHEDVPKFLIEIMENIKKANEPFLVKLSEFFEQQNLTDEEKLRIQFYQDAGFVAINRVLRGTLTASMDLLANSHRKRGDELSEIIERLSLPSDLVLVRIETINSRIIPKEGDVFVDDSFVSTSLNMNFILENIEHMRKNNLPFVIKFIETPKGTSGLIMPEEDQNKRIKNEFEILLQRKTRFKVVLSTNVGDVTFQHLEIIN